PLLLRYPFQVLYLPFYYGSAHHPHLHSFPTRRSSDLVAGSPPAIQHGNAEAHDSSGRLQIHRGHQPLWRNVDPVRQRRHRAPVRSEEHTSELQSRGHLVCRLLLEKKKNSTQIDTTIYT